MTLEKLKICLHYCLPKHLLTRMVGLFASAKLGKLTTLAIKQFIKIYHVNTAEMADKIADYKTFNDFFARALKVSARPINDEEQSIVFPADGRISAFGKLKQNLQLQAKEHYFTTDALLASANDAANFENGSFMTVYLSPSDYHRVHMPFDGKLLKMTYVPGELFSVNPVYTRNIPELFSRNERVVCLFETSIGKMAVILVGATIVRSIAMNWCGIVAPQKTDAPTVTEYNARNLNYQKGDEIGKFMMGSTVICLFEKDKVKFEQSLSEKRHINMGSKMAEFF